MKIKVFIKDAITNEVIRKDEVSTPEYTHEQMNEFHKRFERKYPNAHINFSWKPKKSKFTAFICGVPLNMKLDEIKLERNEISYEEYTTKWYGDVLSIKSEKLELV